MSPASTTEASGPGRTEFRSRQLHAESVDTKSGASNRRKHPSLCSKIVSKYISVIFVPPYILTAKDGGVPGVPGAGKAGLEGHLFAPPFCAGHAWTGYCLLHGDTL